MERMFWSFVSQRPNVLKAEKGIFFDFVILSAATKCLLGRKSLQQLFYAPSFPSRIFSSIYFPILATDSIKLFILPFPLFITLVYTRVCKVDLQIFFFSKKLFQAYKTVSKVSESQMLNVVSPLSLLLSCL